MHWSSRSTTSDLRRLCKSLEHQRRTQYYRGVASKLSLSWLRLRCTIIDIKGRDTISHSTTNLSELFLTKIYHITEFPTQFYIDKACAIVSVAKKVNLTKKSMLEPSALKIVSPRDPYELAHICSIAAAMTYRTGAHTAKPTTVKLLLVKHTFDRKDRTTVLHICRTWTVGN
jgi:hypothetical protein